MEPIIEKVSPFLYFRTIIFGKNRQIRHLSIRGKSDSTLDEDFEVDLIASLGRNVLIITVPHPFKPNNRMPFIVKRWRKCKPNYNERGVAFYIDKDAFRWLYKDNWVGRSLSYSDKSKSYHFHMD